MSNFLNRISKLSAKQLMVLADELNSRIEKLGRAENQPIAVIGVGCRFPAGADTPDLFWEMLTQARDGISQVPPDRWDIERYYDPDPDQPGKMNTRWGGFLDGIERFDAEFFGISPREAVSMDPQQRLALEVAWEAIENAGISPLDLSGTRTGVYLGICNADYIKLIMNQSDEGIDTYMATGSAHSIAAGRISYLLDLEGPSIAVDTACSSSLVAVHLACQSLRANECRMALAGGVNLILTPETTIALSKAHMMSPHGRCKTFDQSADGFVRAEGCGMLVLKRLPDAQADGDPIHGVIMGSAANQDGRSGGITAPNGPSQIDVIRRALRSAGLEPSAVGYVEAHGTGTILGDPIEMRALGEVFGQGRNPDRPLRVGSVKTNIGHSESAAGIAGFIKALLAVQKGEIPPNLHFRLPNKEIAWDRLPIQIPTRRTNWGNADRSRVAGVSSFGFSGTNAHVLIGQAPEPGDNDNLSDIEPNAIILSAGSGRALAQLAGRHARYLLHNPKTSLSDVSRTLTTGRSHLAERAAFVADSVAEAQSKLECIAADQTGKEIIRSKQPVKRPLQVAFMFTGQGSQYVNMGRTLYHSHPVFRDTLDLCAEILISELDRQLIDLLYPASKDDSQLDRTEYAQPALFALEYALAAQWRAWGLEPAAVIGHSVGEYVAACLAGVFDLEEGLRLIARRGKLMQTKIHPGEMAAVAAPADAVKAAIDEIGPGVCIAGLNGPQQTVVSGDPDALGRLLEQLSAQGFGARKLQVTRAFHSHLIEPVLELLAAEVGRINLRPQQIPIFSNLTGKLAETNQMGKAAYWREHSRRPVLFAEGLRAMHEAGYRHFLEIGPHPVLRFLGPDCIDDSQIAWYHGMVRGKDDHLEILRCMGELYVNGAAIKWSQVGKLHNSRRLSLPTYPFQRSKYWLEQATIRPAQADSDMVYYDHPLLGNELLSPALNDIVFDVQLSCQQPAFLKQHRILGQWIMPTPAYLEMALAAAETIANRNPSNTCGWALEDVQIREALILPEAGTINVQTIIEGNGAGQGRSCRFFSAPQGGRGGPLWRLQAECRIVSAAAGAVPPQPDIEQLRLRCTHEIPADQYYQGVQRLGLDFGDAFRGLRRIWKGEGEALGEMTLPAQLELDRTRYQFHPALLDSCFHLLGAALPEESPDQAYLLIGMEQVRLFRKPPAHFWNHTRLRPHDGIQHESISGDITLFDNGGIIAQYRNLLLKKARAESLGAVRRSQGEADGLFRLDWVSHPLPRTVTSDSNNHMMPLDETAEKLSDDLMRYGDENGLWVYEGLLPQLDRWCGSTIARFLYGKDLSRFDGRRFTLDELSAQLRVIPRYKRLLHRMCDILVAEGHLIEDEGRFRLTAHPPETDGAVTPEVMLESFPSCAAEIGMTFRCGRHLHGVLSGERDPLELLFPRGEVQIAEHIYEKSPYALTFNAVVADAVAAETAQRHADGEGARILEIGGGTGGTTSHVLRRLDPLKDRYTFSDISPLFVARAREKYSAYDAFESKVLDIEADPDGQGFAGEHYDIVICANVLHATNNLKAAMKKIHRLLSPGGLLLLLEGTAAQAWVDLTFGLTEGWWRFEDTDIRPDYPLIDRARWRGLLSGCGFESAMVAVDGKVRSADVFNQTVILARRLVMDEDRPKINGTWILFNDPQGLAEALAKPLVVAGAHVERLDFQMTEPDFRAQAAGYLNDILIREKNGELPPLEGIIYFTNGSVTPNDANGSWVPTELTVALAVMQALTDSETTAKMWVCTQGAQVTSPSDGITTPAQASLWGLSRVFSLEHPSRFGGIVDISVDAGVDCAAAQLCAHIATAGDEDQAVLRGGRRLVPRIVSGAEGKISGRPVRLSHEGTYLITGGLGGLGLKVAQWLADLGAGRLILLSRKVLPEKSTWDTLTSDDDLSDIVFALRAIEDKGVEVEPVSVDVGDRTAMAELFKRLRRDAAHSLKGIIHAAVEMSGDFIDRLASGRLEQMFHAKVGGAMLLNELSLDMPLDFFVLFSSTTSLWGVAGLGHYAAANQVLDLLAHRRRQNGLHALSINWGTWEQMRVASHEDRQAFREAGLNPMPAQEALDLLGRLIDSDVTQVCAASVDWDRLRSLYEVRRPRPMFSRIGQKDAAPEVKASPGTERLQDRLMALPDHRRRGELVGHLQTRVREVLRLAADMNVDCEKGFFDMGMDSLMAVELRSLLEKDMGLSLPSTLTFNYPTIDEVAGFIMVQLSSLENLSNQDLTDDHEPASSSGEAQVSDQLTEGELSDLLIQKLKDLE